MYQQPVLAMRFINIVTLIIQIIVPILLFIVFIWLTIRVISFLTLVLSQDGGLSIREQRHHLRLRNLAAFMTFSAVTTGGIMILDSRSAGSLSISSPGGITIENVGIGVIFLGIASSFLWMLMKAKVPKYKDSISPTTSSAASTGSSVTVVGFFQNMTYLKAGVITLVLLPFINIFAIPIGIFLFWNASSRD